MKYPTALLLLFVLLPQLAVAQEREELPPTITFPQLTIPVREPDPGSIPRLNADTWYVVQSETPFILLASPAGYVEVKNEEGPLKILGKFIDAAPDGSTGTQVRTYHAKYLATVRGIKTGRVELLAVPAGATAEEQITRTTIDVHTGQAPQPPPVTPPVEPPVDPPPVDPPVDPPEPPPPPEPEDTSFKVLFLFESTADQTREQLGILNSTKLRSWLKTNTDGYRFWDKDVDVSREKPEWKELLAAAKAGNPPLPAVVVFKGKAGKAYLIGSPSYPATANETATLEFLKTQKGAQ